MKDDIFSWCRSGDYQRENFDSFLKSVGFNFSIPSVHIAGTNGKGTVTNFLSQVFINEGYKVGTFSSPYFYEINELIKVNNSYISDEKFLNIYNEYLSIFIDYNLSAFEIQTFVAFKFFEEEKCDICFIECGMGGRVDATNIFIPFLSIISSIGLEHTNFLGKTYEEIAFSKGGIIKKDVPSVIGKINAEAEKVIIDICKERHSKLIKVVDPSFAELNETGYKFSYSNFKNVQLKSKSFYSVFDACIALEAINVLKKSFSLTDEKVISSFLVDNLSARFSILNKDKLTIIDGAHNPEAMDQLKQEISVYCKENAVHVIFSCFKDKNFTSMLASLNEITNSIYLTTFDHVRARTEEEYFLYLDEFPFVSDPIECYKKVREMYPNDYIVITGSLAFAGYMINKLNKE